MTIPPRRVVVDTDGGIDDLVALAWLLTQPEIEVSAIIATGGARRTDIVGSAITYALQELDPVRRPPLLRGADIEPSMRATVPSAVHLHGEYGLGPLTPPRKADFDGDISDDVLPSHTDYLVLGPLTTAERLMRRQPWSSDTRLTVMGGAFSAPGIIRGAEPNFARDPRAASLLLADPPGRGVRIVPTDATTQGSLCDDVARRLVRPGKGWAGLQAVLLTHYWSAAPPRYCHDLVAAAVLARPATVTTEPEAAVTIDKYGRTRMTATTGSAVTVVLGLDVTAWHAITTAWAMDRN